MPYNIRRFDLNALPSALTAIKKGVIALPDYPVVYIIFGQEEAYYVGATKSLFNRWSGLKNDSRINKFLGQKGVKIAWFAASMEQLSGFELALIQFLNPKVNCMRRGKTYHYNGIGNNTRRLIRQRLEKPALIV